METKSIISKWFKPAARQWAEDALWKPQEECLKNTSNLKLVLVLDNDDALYWEQEDNAPKPPKWPQVPVEEESLNDSVSTIKMAMSAKELAKSAIKNFSKASTSAMDEKKLILALQQSIHREQPYPNLPNKCWKSSNPICLHASINFAAQMAILITNSLSSPKKCPARGHKSESGLAT